MKLNEREEEDEFVCLCGCGELEVQRARELLESTYPQGNGRTKTKLSWSHGNGGVATTKVSLLGLRHACGRESV